jgi:hypothetical protein
VGVYIKNPERPDFVVSAENFGELEKMISLHDGKPVALKNRVRKPQWYYEGVLCFAELAGENGERTRVPCLDDTQNDTFVPLRVRDELYFGNWI